MKPRLVDLPVYPRTRAIIKKLKGPLTYDEFLLKAFGGKA